MKNQKQNNRFDVVGWIITIAVAAVVFLIGNYLCLPRIGWSFGMLALIAVSAGLGWAASAIYNWATYDCWGCETSRSVRNWALGISIGVLVVAIIISAIASWTLFHVDDAKGRINITTVTREELLEKLPEVEENGAYSWVDSDAAIRVAKRKTGDLTDLVSLYTANSEVTTAVREGQLVKYVPLAYGGFFKAMKVETIPGYIVVDPVTQMAEYVECAFSYSPSAYFGKDLMRHLRKNYPTDYLGNYTFQVDPEGVPYWVCELRKSCGSWFVKETYAVAVVNAQTGKCTKYEIGDTPDWVVAIYGDTATEYYNTYGSLINGYWNFSQVGETSTTDNFGYVAINGQMYYYTGVTSAVVDGGDEANLGILLYNAHTNEAEYCQISGAEEYSAMEAAEGVVQNFGYEASFPSLTSVNGELTYTMVLKDANGIVKQYAMVSYNNYTIAVTADSLSACSIAYAKALTKNGVVDNDSTNWVEIDIVVDAIEYIVQSGETTVYIRGNDGAVYKAAFDERFLFADIGDTVTVQVIDDSTEIKTVIYSNLVEIESVDGETCEEVVEEETNS